MPRPGFKPTYRHKNSTHDLLNDALPTELPRRGNTVEYLLWTTNRFTKSWCTRTRDRPECFTGTSTAPSTSFRAASVTSASRAATTSRHTCDASTTTSGSCATSAPRCSSWKEASSFTSELFTSRRMVKVTIAKVWMLFCPFCHLGTIWGLHCTEVAACLLLTQQPRFRFWA